jgi:hypothetical protein
MIHRDVIEAFGTTIDMTGSSDIRSAFEAAISEFDGRYESDAEITLQLTLHTLVEGLQPPRYEYGLHSLG